MEDVPVSGPSVRALGRSCLPASSEKSKMRKVRGSPVKLFQRFQLANPAESLRKKTLVKIQVLIQPWTSSNPTEGLGQLEETVRPLLFFKADCQNCTCCLLKVSSYSHVLLLFPLGVQHHTAFLLFL